MKDFFENGRRRMREFMTGRYGTDEFSRFLLIAALVLLFLSLFSRLGILYYVALACLIYTFYRTLSRNYGKRRAENESFLRRTSGIRKKLRVQKRRFDERKEYRYFKCPSCGQDVRVPRGKGHIRITCPKCRTQFDRNV